MHFKDFEEHMTLILDGHEILAENVDMSKKLRCIELGRRSYQVCREYFKDEAFCFAISRVSFELK